MSYHSKSIRTMVTLPEDVDRKIREYRASILVERNSDISRSEAIVELITLGLVYLNMNKEKSGDVA